MALLDAGDHILVPASVYSPNRKLTTYLLSRFGVTATFYDPGIGAGICNLVQENTCLFWTGSPESITMQAVTKYIGGHSDVLLGSITVRYDGIYGRLGAARQVIGCGVSPRDCSLALRGLQTLAVRLPRCYPSRGELPS